jgi:hypothetical protein
MMQEVRRADSVKNENISLTRCSENGMLSLSVEYSRIKFN